MENKKTKSAYFTLPLQSEFTGLIKNTRKSQGLDQSDVVNLVNRAGGKISLKSYSHYERGEREPKLETARMILLVLGLIDDGGTNSDPAQQIPMSKWSEMAFNEVDEGYAAVRKEGEVEYYMKYRFQKLSKEDVEGDSD